MLETSKEIWIKKKKEQQGGPWFPFTKNKYLKAIEIIGQSIAFSIRSLPFLRLNIGAKTFKWRMLIGAFVWFRFWVLFGAGQDQFLNNLFNPFIESPFSALILSVLSYMMLVRGISIKIKTGYKFAIKNEDVNTGVRGNSDFFDYKVQGNEVAGRNWFKQVVLEPIVLLLLGILTYRIEGFQALGLFLLIGCVPFFIDEYLHHVAKGELLLDERQKMYDGEKKMDRHDELDQGGEERNLE